MRQFPSDGRWWLVFGLTLLSAGSCNRAPAIVVDDGPPDGSATVDSGRPCVNLECRIPRCPAGQTTTLSGEVRTPNRGLPLPGVVVYVPNAPLLPLTVGASCNRCDSQPSGQPLVSELSAIDGTFRLKGVPAGDNIPLVIQAGKWRRQVTLPYVEPCVDNPLDTDTTRLPRMQSEGDLPKIAVTTGGADALECLLRKIGVDAGEFTPEAGSGRVNLYSGFGGTTAYRPADNGGAVLTPAPTLWSSLDNLKRYDVLLMSCEGSESQTNKSPEARAALRDYLGLGGRVFASHWHNYWLEFGAAPLPSLATFNHRPDLPNPVGATIDTSTERGASLADWLLLTGGSSERGHLQLVNGKNTVESINRKLAQGWIYVPGQTTVQVLSFNAPVGVPAADQCGRMVLTDLHMTSEFAVGSAPPFPSGCVSTDFSPQEKALVFMLFDLTGCLVPIIG
jgi:hypothetical protein